MKEDSMRLNRKMSILAPLLLVVFVALPSAYQARTTRISTGVCLQDDSNPAVMVQWDTVTGAYSFCCGGTTFTGVGLVTNRGQISTLQVYASDRRIVATSDRGANRGDASLRFLPSGVFCTIMDRDTTNDSCSCGMSG